MNESQTLFLCYGVLNKTRLLVPIVIRWANSKFKFISTRILTKYKSTFVVTFWQSDQHLAIHQGYLAAPSFSMTKAVFTIQVFIDLISFIFFSLHECKRLRLIQLLRKSICKPHLRWGISHDRRLMGEIVILLLWYHQGGY